MPSGVRTYCIDERRVSWLSNYAPQSSTWRPASRVSFRVAISELLLIVATTHVVVLPRELGGEVALGGQGLARLDDLEVGDIELGVLGSVVILLGDENTL